MPIEYQRDDRRRLITVTITELCSFEELLNQTDPQWAENAWNYAALYDVRAVAQPTHERGLQQLVDRMHAVGAGQPRGPVGIVIAPRPDMLRSGLRLAKPSRRGRDIELLMSEEQVNEWLTRNAPMRAP
jgi:hypothetical protein